MIIEKKTYFIISWNWQYGNKSGSGSSTRWFKDFNGKIGQKSLDWLKKSILEDNRETFRDMSGNSFVFFISAISLLGEMTDEEFKDE